MTDTAQIDIEAALALVDSALGQMSGRENVSASEVADLLLDVRMLLAAAAAEAASVPPTPAPAAL